MRPPCGGGPAGNCCTGGAANGILLSDCDATKLCCGAGGAGIGAGTYCGSGIETEGIIVGCGAGTKVLKRMSLKYLSIIENIDHLHIGAG